MNPATEALEDIDEASKLENRTKKATDPESDEDKAMCEESNNSQHPKEFASQGEEETNALQGEANSLGETPTEDEVSGVTSRNSSADAKLNDADQK